MIDHFSLPVADFARSRAFYDACLAPLGYEVVMEMTDAPDYVAAGYGGKAAAPEREFWIGGPKGPAGAVPVSPEGQHIAFAAPDRASIDAFYAAALARGGKDNGPPGLRLHYHPNYYAAFVLDPDGHRIEAVCHKPE